jgi:hypothetical protein
MIVTGRTMISRLRPKREVGARRLIIRHRKAGHGRDQRISRE